MAARKGKKASKRVTVTMRARRGDVDLRDVVARFGEVRRGIEGCIGRAGDAGPSDALSIADSCRPKGQPTPASEIALNDLQAALYDLGAQVIQLRNELELVLAPAAPRAVAEPNSVGEPPRSPLTNRIRGLISDLYGTRDMLRDIRDRLEVGAQEPGF